MVTGKVGIGEVAGAFAELANRNRHTKILGAQSLINAGVATRSCRCHLDGMDEG